MNPKYEAARSQGVEVLKSFNELVGVGMAGSQALGLEDEYSDLDLQAFVNTVPMSDRRKAAYERHESVEVISLDHPVAEDFEKPPCSVHFVVDWLNIRGVKCDFLWLPKHEVEELLLALPAHPDQRETIAVLARTVQPVFDPDGYIENLRQNCPDYPEERARVKAGGHLRYAHFFLCDWSVLEKCIRRGDVIAYHQAESEMIGVLVDTLYAVNRVWQHNRRRLRFHASDFTILPKGFLDRLESMILKTGKHTSLDACHRGLLSLFHDLAVAANEKYETWQLPSDWRIRKAEGSMERER